MTARKRECSEVIRAGWLKKAKEFYAAAVLVENAAPNASVDLFVDAGIAAADAGPTGFSGPELHEFLAEYPDAVGGYARDGGSP